MSEVERRRTVPPQSLDGNGLVADADALAAAVQVRRREAAHRRAERAPQQFGDAALALRADDGDDARFLFERRLERCPLERVALYGALLDRHL